MRPVPMEPPEVPVDFWVATPLRDAFAAHHMGRVVRAYRTHPWHGRRPLPQELVAGWLSTTQPRLSRAENGSRLEHLDVLVHWATTLKMPQRYLWFTLPSQQTTATGHRPTAVEQIRNLVLGVTDGGGGGASDPQHSSPSAVVRLRKRIAQAWSTYQEGAYTNALALVPDNLRTAHAVIAVRRGQQRLRAYQLAAFVHHHAAAVLTKIGEPDLAWVTAERGLVLACESENATAVSSLRRSVGHCLMSTGRLTAADAVISAGLAEAQPPRARSTPAALSVHGTLALTGAVLAARRGDFTEAASLIFRAERSAGELGRDANHLWTAFGPSNVAVHQVSMHIDRGAHRRALDLAARLDLSVLPVERRVRAMLDSARALNAGQRATDALAVVLQAERTASELVRHHYITRELVVSWTRQQRTEFVTPVRELSDRLGLTP